METYLSVYLGSAFLALIITPVIIWGARRVNIVDIPVTRSLHLKPIPHVGGISIFISMMCLTALVLFLPNAIGDAFGEILPEVVVLLLAAAFMFAVGLIDDIINLRARIKLLGQLAAAIAVCSIGIRIETVAVADWFTLDFGWFSWPLTILWIVSISNAVNLSDGMDGLAAGISAVACGVIAVLAIQSGQLVMAVLMLALLGSLTGFLFFNFNPAKIFMGDCGSLFLGFTISASSVMCSTKSHTLVGLALPALALGIPIFDTLFSMLRRFLERRSLFAPDRKHFHHRLLDLGFTQRHAVLLAYAITLLAAGLGTLMVVTESTNSPMLFICIVLLLLLVFRAVGSVRLRETISGLQKRYAVDRQIRAEVQSFEDIQLCFRRIQTLGDWWKVVCEAAEQLGLMRLKLRLKNGDNTYSVLTWHKDGNGAGALGEESMTISTYDIESESGLDAEIGVNANGSLESAGRRVALFSRLLDEHRVIDLSEDEIGLLSTAKEDMESLIWDPVKATPDQPAMKEEHVVCD